MSTKKKATYTEPILIKLDKATKKALASRAERERRKPGQLARILIEDGLCNSAVNQGL